MAKDREMLTSPRKDLKEFEEEMPTGLWKAPPMRVGDVSVPVKAPRKERLCSLGTRRTGRWSFSPAYGAADGACGTLICAVKTHRELDEGEQAGDRCAKAG